MSIEVTLSGTIPQSEVETLVVLLEGISGYDREVEIVHEVLLRNGKGSEMRMRRKRTINTSEIPTTEVEKHLEESEWIVELVGPRQNAIHDANVRTIHRTSLPAVPGFTCGDICLKRGSPNAIGLFLSHVGGFSMFSSTLRVGFVITLPGPIDVSVFQLFISDSHVPNFKLTSPDTYIVLPVVSSTPDEVKNDIRPIKSMVNQIVSLKDSIQQFVELLP